MIDTFKKKIDSRIEQFEKFKDNTGVFKAVDLIENLLRKGGRIFIFGNGGSSAQSSHFAAELVNKFYFERGPLPAVALTTDTAALTSIANDSLYKYVFSRQLEALGRKNDIAIGLTTSGMSPNVLEAFHSAERMKLKTLALCGNNTTPLLNHNIDVIISVPSEDVPIIQEMHLFILHSVAEMLEKRFYAGDK